MLLTWIALVSLASVLSLVRVALRLDPYPASPMRAALWPAFAVARRRSILAVVAFAIFAGACGQWPPGSAMLQGTLAAPLLYLAVGAWAWLAVLPARCRFESYELDTLQIALRYAATWPLWLPGTWRGAEGLSRAHSERAVRSLLP